jgi:hypothetical protein
VHGALMSLKVARVSEGIAALANVRAEPLVHGAAVPPKLRRHSEGTSTLRAQDSTLGVASVLSRRATLRHGCKEAELPFSISARQK